MSPQTRRLGLPVLLVALPALLFPSETALAQFRIRGIRIQPNGRVIVGTAEQQTDSGGGPAVDVDKDVSKRLDKARALLREGEYENGVEVIQSVLDRKSERNRNEQFRPSEDYFVDQSMSRSLKHEALRLLEELPPEGRRQYELRFGIDARKLLDEATRTGQTRKLQQVARRYFHTPAGYEAAFRLATHKLDNSEPLAAALGFDQLLRLPKVASRWEPLLSVKASAAWLHAGYPERSVEILTALKESSGDDRIVLGGRPMTLFDSDKQALGWLAGLVDRPPALIRAAADDWPLLRGDARRNAVSSPASPVWDSEWKRATVRDDFAEPFEDSDRLAEVDRHLKRFVEEQREAGVLTQPAAHPLVVGNAVIFRTMRNVRAVDLTTGELLWESIVRGEPYAKLVAGTGDDYPATRVHRESPLETLLAQRSWRDLTAGTLSSDGRHVYSLEELGFLGPYRSSSANPHPLAPQPHNKLTAFDLAADGYLIWQAGGPLEEGLPMAGAFFLGPPLPLDGKLYCVAEVSGDIRLVVLDVDEIPTEHGRRYEPAVLWSQSLVLPELSIQQDPLRRLSGAAPSYGDGILVCPTTAGAVVAVDLARRMLLWGYRYRRSVPGLPQNPLAAAQQRALGGFTTSGRDDEDRWLDSAVTIVDGKVLLTPRDSTELHCLKLLDGELLWKNPRGQGLYLASTDEKRVIVVGRTQVQALNPTDGEPLWKAPVSIDMPSGRGFRTGRFYHLPLESGEIVTIDLDEGRIVARSKSRTGEVFGNLVAAGGAIVSQSADAIVGFRSLDSLNEQIRLALAENPDDPQALALRGEMLLHQGEEQRGLSDLRRSIRLNPTPRAKQLVVATLLDGMRRDFAKYRGIAPEIERLVEDPRQRGEYLRLHAAGLHEIGESQGAFREYVKLATADTGKPELERVNAVLSVRSDRWVRPRIAELYERATPSRQAEMRQTVEALLEESLQEEATPEQLRRFLEAFADLPVADAAGRALAERLDPEKDALELESLLRRLQRSESPKIAAIATARLAKLYIRHGRPVALAAMLGQLGEQWKDVVSLNGKTGAELVQQWWQDEQVAAMLKPDAGWPEKQLEANRKSRRGRVERYFPIDRKGPRGPFGEGWTLLLDSRRQFLIARDGEGRELWRLQTDAIQEGISNVYGNYVRMNGHLLVVVLGTHFVVLDALQKEGEAPAVLWQRSLMEGAGSRDPNIQWVGVGGGRRVLVVRDRLGRPIGDVVPIGSGLVCYQVGTRLFAADPLTGETLWQRRSVRRGSEFFGDDRFVFLVEPGAEETLVLRAADGQQAATPSLPLQGSRLATQGRNVLVWSIDGGRGRLAFVDAGTGSTKWRQRFSADAKTFVIENDEVAVLEPGGRFAVLRIADGAIRVDSPVQDVGRVEAVMVQRSRNWYVMLTYGPNVKANNAAVAALNSGNPLVNGLACGFDRQTGEKLWSAQVENQAIDLSQPVDVPILVFTARTYARVFRGGFNPNQFSLLVLDKRTGKTVYSKVGREPLSPFDIEVDTEDNRLQINFHQSLIELSTTGKPLQRPPSGTSGK